MNSKETIEALKAEVLEESRQMLIKKNLTRYIPYLKSKYVISRDDQEEINMAGITKAKNDKIIDFLLMRGSKSYDHLCNAMLEERVDASVVVQLNMALETKISKAFKTEDSVMLVEDTTDTSQLPTPSSVGII